MYCYYCNYCNVKYGFMEMTILERCSIIYRKNCYLDLIQIYVLHIVEQTPYSHAIYKILLKNRTKLIYRLIDCAREQLGNHFHNDLT